MPELVRSGDAEVAGPPTPVESAAALDQPLLAHHYEHSLAVNRLAELARDERCDHAVAVGGCRARPRRSRGRPGRLAGAAGAPSRAAAPGCDRSPAGRSAAPVRPLPA